MGDIHTCHADCPCHTGGEPTPDFLTAAASQDTNAQSEGAAMTATGRAKPKTEADVLEVVGRVMYDEKTFRVGHMGEGFFVQIEYLEDDAVTGEPDQLQRGRKWYVSPWATDSEIVQTMLAAVLASAEHQAREAFRYAGPCATCEGEGTVRRFGANPTCPECAGSGRGKPRAIYAPHFSADALYGICGKKANYDARDNPS